MPYVARLTFCVGVLVALVPMPTQAAASLRAANIISLAGEWRFALDPGGQGRAERWFERTLADRLRLPGALTSQGFGDDVTATTAWTGSLHDPLWARRSEYRGHSQPGRVRTPFLLQPDKHYVGAAWYQRDVVVPAGWRGRRVVLALERPHGQTQAWWDGMELGARDSLGTPHEYELGLAVPGRHTLTLCVDNRLVVNVGSNAHSVTDYTQGNWNGVVGALELRATSSVYLDDVQVFPNVAAKTARVRVRIGNASGRPGRGRVTVGAQTEPIRWQAQGGEVEIAVALGSEARPWDEFDPALTRLAVRLTGDGADDGRDVVFGLREIAALGSQLTLNGRKVYLRGTHEGCTFPLTGYPPTDVAAWRRIFRIAQAHGLNHMRFHSWCPPEAAFVAADELGFYLQPECSIWARDGVRIDPGSPLEAWLYEESARMLKAYGNHPSFVLLTHGNEPEGRWVESATRWVAALSERDPRRLYGAATGWPLKRALGPVEGTQFSVFARIGQEQLRGFSGWNGKDYRVIVESLNVPVITHELGQHCAYPDFAEAAKYTGPLKPLFYEIFQESLAARGMTAQAADFHRASGRLQVLAYKEDIEASLRTPGHAGFQLLDLHDYPGQGFSPIGILDAFWDPKSYASAAEFRRFSNVTVPLARLSSRTLTTAEALSAQLEVAHFGPAPLADAVAEWKVLDGSGGLVARGELPAQPVGFGTAQRLGVIEIPLARFASPAAYRLVVGLRGTPFENDWNFWVYPAAVETGVRADVLIATAFDAQTRATLAAGGKVLLLPPADALAWDSPPFGFLPIFWNRQLFPRWERSLGILCDPRHPALAAFPTAFHSDWQWAGLLGPGVRAFNVNALPAELRPIVQGIDDWNRNHKLALLFEARVGPGRLLMSAFDLTGDLSSAPARREMLASLLAYAASERFQPAVAVQPSDIEALFFETKVMTRLGATATAEAGDWRGEARQLVDGDPNTVWTTPAGAPGFPYRLTITLAQPTQPEALLVLNGQRDRKRQGEIRDYVIEGSADGATWRELARGTLEPTYALQNISLQASGPLRHLRLTAFGSHDGGRVAALAEIAVVEAPSTP